MNGSWYDRALDAINKVGFPIVVCGILFAWVFGFISSPVTDLVRLMHEHDITTRELIKATRTQTLLTTCLAYARTAEVQQRCVEQYQSPSTP